MWDPYSQDHDDLIRDFENNYASRNLDKEDKSRWRYDTIYRDLSVNDLFLAYRAGYLFGLSIGVWDE